MDQEKRKREKNSLSIWDLLSGEFLKKEQVVKYRNLGILIFFLTFIHINNRYAGQQEFIEINKLEEKLLDIKYHALSRSSELMERSRQSKIEEYITTQNSELEIATTPPYLIK